MGDVDEVTTAAQFAEFIGTFLLVFTIGCNVITGSSVWAATSIACVLMVSIYALGGVSGANFNPAVSIALGLSNKLPWPHVGNYVCIQFGAGILAGGSYSLMFGEVFSLAPAKDPGHWFHACLAEMIYTFMLCFVVLNVACSDKHKNKDQFYGLAIGFVIIAGGYAAGHLSGGCFNPAVAFGIDISNTGIFKVLLTLAMPSFTSRTDFGWCFAYMAFEFAGAAIAAGLFRVVRPEDFGGELAKLPGKLVSEFLGTFMLVLTVGLNVIGQSPAPVWSIAASLMCMIYALGTVSSAHFNPAVTVSILLSGRDKISLKEAGAYIGVQLIAGLCASYTYAFLEDGQTFPLQPGAKFGWLSAGCAEIVFTCLLCFVVLSVATAENTGSKQFFGLAIGSCVTAGGYAIGAVSGGSLNPAVSMGISGAHIINGGHFWHCLIYIVFELIGACIASGIFKATHPSEYPEIKSSAQPAAAAKQAAA